VRPAADRALALVLGEARDARRGARTACHGRRAGERDVAYCSCRLQRRAQGRAGGVDGFGLGSPVRLGVGTLGKEGRVHGEIRMNWARPIGLDA
jgi:hypothetical protein